MCILDAIFHRSIGCPKTFLRLCRVMPYRTNQKYALVSCCDWYFCGLSDEEHLHVSFSSFSETRNNSSDQDEAGSDWRWLRLLSQEEPGHRGVFPGWRIDQRVTVGQCSCHQRGCWSCQKVKKPLLCTVVAHCMKVWNMTKVWHQNESEMPTNHTDRKLSSQKGSETHHRGVQKESTERAQRGSKPPRGDPREGSKGLRKGLRDR